MRTQMEKAEAFRALHARPGAFIIPNPWDAGTAKLLAAMGFEALATTSLGLANTLGSATVSLDAIIENCRMIADATDLPSTPIWRIAARTIRRPRRKRSRARPKQAASAARSRIRPAIQRSRSTISSSR
jgi:PEP phosphonomutase and related enzymes